MVWKREKNNQVEYITFWCDDGTIPAFTLKRVLERLNKNIAEFKRFMEAKYGAPYEIAATQESDPIEANLQLEVKPKQV